MLLLVAPHCTTTLVHPQYSSVSSRNSALEPVPPCAQLVVIERWPLLNVRFELRRLASHPRASHKKPRFDVLSTVVPFDILASVPHVQVASRRPRKTLTRRVIARPQRSSPFNIYKLLTRDEQVAQQRVAEYTNIQESIMRRDLRRFAINRPLEQSADVTSHANCK